MAISIDGTNGLTTDNAALKLDGTTLAVDDTNNRVGIGTSSPSYKTHIVSSSSGAGTASGDKDDLVIENSGHAGITTLAGNSSESGIFFGHTSDVRAGEIYTKQSDALMTVGSRMSGGQLRFLSGDGSEAMRIDSSGRLLINNTSLTNGYLNVLGDGITTDAVYIQQNNSTSRGLQTNCTASSFSKIVGLQYATRSNDSAYFFHRSYSSGGADQEFYVRGDGQVGADGSFFGGGADYAEYFEWSDGNASNEDRRGYTVVLDGNKVRKATDDDNVSQIIGAVSSRPSVVGDADMDAWKDKYLRDDFGSYITETHNVIEWTDEDGVEHSYESHRVPDDIVVPADAIIKAEDEDGNLFTHRTLNPDYDESFDYVAREDRPEWDAIGMMGKLRIRTGQPVGDRWIKMRDISDSVEEWLVR